MHTQAKCRHETLVNEFTNCSNQASAVTPTDELVPAQVELCECSQLTELGWDATCQPNAQVSNCALGPLTNCNQASLGCSHPSAGWCATGAV